MNGSWLPIRGLLTAVGNLAVRAPSFGESRAPDEHGVLIGSKPMIIILSYVLYKTLAAVQESPYNSFIAWAEMASAETRNPPKSKHLRNTHEHSRTANRRPRKRLG